MKRLACIFFSVLALVVITQSTALSVYDPPHNETNNIFCADCHGIALDIRDSEDNPIVSPFWDGTSSADAVYNALCLRCHNGSDAPLANTHTPGTTLIKCTICHHNHAQDQVYPGKYNKNNFFIARGTALSAVESGGVTTISYTVPAGLWATNPGSDWAADLANLAAKTDAGRGAMLVPSISWNQSRWPVFEIESIDTTTGEITVKGDASTTATELKARAADFGIFYGQQVRSIITYEGNVDYVEFYDNRGNYSFINQTAATGLCQICHTNTKYFQSTLGAAPGGDSHNAGSDCSLCHQHNDVTNGGFFPSADHETDGMVTYPAPATDNCELCHIGDVVSGKDTHDSQCVLCHNLADFTLKLVGETGGRVAAMPDGGTSGGSDGGGTCTACHTDHLDWYYHVVDHELLGWVTSNTDTSSNTVNCTGCHDASGILAGVHDLSGVAATQVVCNKCHLDGPATKDLRNVAAGKGESPANNDDDHAVSPANECDSCHTTYFENHAHVHVVSYNAGVDVSQNNNIPANACAVCHNDSGNSFAAFTDIEYEHDVTDGTQDGTGSCVTCHDYDTIGNQTGDADTPLSTTVTSLIDNNTTSTCVTCHEPKNWVSGVSSEHGGHENNHFAWDSNCIDCHSTANDYVVQEVHSNTCLMCHITAAGGTGTAKVGDPANGVDCDATLGASAAPHAAVACTTCHDIADPDVNAASIGGMHHDNKTDGIVDEADCTTKCHNVSGHEGNHTALIDDSTTYCVACHTGIEGGGAGTGAPIAPADPETHDGCTTCHAIAAIPAADGYLLDFATADTRNPDVIDAMPNGGAGTNNGGGQCTACHTAWDAMHSHAITDFNSDLANCNSACHIKLPAEGVVQDTHSNDCSFCHNTTTYQVKLGDSFLALDGPKGDATKAIGNLAANCIVCHDVVAPVQFDFSTIHHETTNNYADAGNCVTCHVQFTSLGGDHTLLVDEAATGCDSCHPATAGTATGISVTAADNEKHDACITCHNTDADATLKTLVQADTNNPDRIIAMPNGGAGSDNGGGDCTACHGAYFINHDHGLNTPNYTAGHDVTYDSLTDLSQVSLAGDNPCGDCHDGNNADTNGIPLDSWTDIYSEHQSSCALCHSYTAGTTPPFATVISEIATGTGVECVTCHTPKLDPAGTSDHGGHDDAQFAWTAGCGAVGCHDQAGNPGVANDIHGDGTRATCTMCHTTAAGGTGTAKIGAAANGVDADATLGASAAPHAAVQCTTCHNIADADVNAVTLGGIHHDNKTDGVVVEADCSTKCHNVSGEEGDHTALVADSTTYCVACHTAYTAPGVGSKINSGDALVHDGCLVCHAIAAIPAADGYLLDFATADTRTPDIINAMPNPSDPPYSNGGGDCSACHVAWDAMHSHAVSDFESDLANCNSSCHVLVPATDNIVQTTHSNDCSFCHNMTTYQVKLGDSFAALDGPKGDATKAIGNLAANCIVCHDVVAPAQFDFSTIHHETTNNLADLGDCTTTCHIQFTSLGGDHTLLVDEAATGCDSCHPATAGTATGISVTAADNEKHDACITCHNTDFDATLKTFAQADAHTPDWITAMPNGGAGSDNGGGDCAACHGAYFDSHDHGLNTPNYTAGHDVTYDSLTDLSQVSLAGDNPCGDCHDGNNADTNGIPLDSWTDIYSEHQGSCALCHSYTAGTTPPFATVISEIATGTGVECVTCHTPKLDPAGTSDHGYYDHATNPGGGLAYAPITKTSNCTDNCHSGEVVIAVHADDCTVCHTTAPTLKSTPDLAQFAGTTTACIDCHKDGFDLDGVGPYTYHGISYAHSETLTRHNNLSDSDSSMTYDCQACHTDMSTTTLKLQKHMATDTVADCYRCHFPNVWGGLSDTPAQTAITNGKGAGSAQTCEDCHTSKDTYLLHGLTAADVATDNEHNNLTTSGIAGDTDCANCHTMSNETEKLNLHMSPTNSAHSGNCLTCHTAADDATPSGSASTIITAGKSGGGNTAQQCNDCHIAKGSYLLHGLASNTVNDVHENLSVSTNAGSGTETDCAECHTITTDVNRIDLHLAPTCSTCHAAAGVAVTVIANGWDDGSPTTANCESCHTAKAAYLRHGLTDDNGADGVVDVHDQFNIQTGSSTSTCSSASCHNTTAVNDIATMQLHTRATTPTTCLTCHQDGAPVSTVIAAGWGSANAAQCDECHTTLGGDWYTHSVDHTASGMNVVLPQPAGASRTVSCSSTNCHAAQGDIITGVHDIYAPTGGTNPCKECHDLGGALIDGNDGYGDARLGGTGATCSTCHASGFDIHLHDHSTTVPFIPGTDESQAAPGTDCNVCHGVGAGPYSLANWSERLYEHDFVNAPQDGAGACTSCHDYDTRGNQTGTANTPLAATVTGAIDNNTPVSCIGCHAGKVQPNTHGGHKNTDFQWVDGVGSRQSCGTGAGTAGANLAGCHDSSTATNVISVIHNGSWASGYGTTCQNCHNQPSTASGGDNNTGPGSNGDGTAEIIANGGPANATTHTEVCTTCHAGTVSAIHHDRTEATGGTCIVCHKPDVGQNSTDGPSTRTVADVTQIVMPRNLACDFCHLKWPTGAYAPAGGPYNIYRLGFDPNTNPATAPTSVAIASHAISTNGTTPISDYAACFACHGATGTDNGPGSDAAGADMVKPFHGMGVPYTNANDGAYRGTKGNGGGYDDFINMFMAPETECEAAAVHTTSIHPGAINFNALADQTDGVIKVGFVAGGNPKAFSNSASKGGGSSTPTRGSCLGTGKPIFHQADQYPVHSFASAGTIETGTFQIPWDGFASSKIAPAAGSITLNLGHFGTPTTTPLVPLY